jgi:signal transduction histidine kinase
MAETSAKRRRACPPDPAGRGAAARAQNSAGSPEARHDELRRLADEQAALRRVATLVAQAVAPSDLFGAVAREVGRLLGADRAALFRYESDDTETAVATWVAAGQHVEAGRRWPLPGGIAAFICDELGVSSSVGAPIVVEGRLWGALIIHSAQTEPLPPDTESRLTSFTDLVSTAISNADARAEVRRLADEQAALRRVATLVAQTESTPEMFEAVTREIGLLCRADLAFMGRYEPDGTVTAVAGWSADDEGEPAVGARSALEATRIAALVRETDRPARVDSFAGASGPIAREARARGIRSSVGCPIAVGGRTWGVIAAFSRGALRFPAETESQMAEFTELVATAVSNAQARGESTRLTEQQAALRRVATLVAEAAPPGDVFTAVAEGLARLLGADTTMVTRVDTNGMMTVVAHCGCGGEETHVGSRWTLEQPPFVAAVVQTRGSVRVDADGEDPGPFGAFHALGLASAVATPVVVAGRVWGATIVATQREPLASDAEQRMADFTDLVATAIANADGRAQLVASRARLLTAGDDARRRVVRDLHDGAQQRLVSTILALRLARKAQRDEDDESADAFFAEALEHAEQANAELRELARGILPPALTRGGLRRGVDALVSRLPMPVDVAVPDERLPAEIEASAYFVVAEALTNVVKHARAHRAEVEARVDGNVLRLDVRDDGVGGVRADGTALLGLYDRLAAHGGRLRVESPPGGGTRITATLPL